MIALYVHKIVYIVVLFLGTFSLNFLIATAQSNPLSNTEGVDLVSLATTSTSSAPLVEVVEQPWFKIEQLSGIVNQGDFVVGPGRAEIEIKPGQTVTYEISVANRISDGRQFELTVEDVAGSEDGSRSVVLLGEERGPYTIKDYITFPKNKFNLNLGERARIPVTISIPKDAAPGGYYGSVLVSTVRVNPDEDPTVGTATSPIVARIGTLFFVTVPGEVERSGQLKDLTLINKKIWYEKGPIKFSAVYENTGSVHLNPYGEIRIKNLFAEEVGFIELEPWFSLPKSLRSREISWDRELLFGRYVATVYINRGYEDIIDEESVTFWVLPWKIVVGVFVTLFIIIFSLRFFLRTFEFKRKR